MRLTFTENLTGTVQVMKQVLKLKCSATFAVPVTEERAPNYSSVIKEPRDLGTISGKLGSSDGYSSLGRASDNQVNLNGPMAQLMQLVLTYVHA